MIFEVTVTRRATALSASFSDDKNQSFTSKSGSTFLAALTAAL